MTNEEIISKLKDLLKKASPSQADWSGMTGATTIESLGFDSLSILDLTYDIQQEFKVEFEAEEMVRIKTIGDLAAFLRGKGA
jgi:acyl carrier protein